MDSIDYRKKVASNLDTVKEKMNMILRGENLADVEDILARIDVSGETPYWFKKLKDGCGVPVKDGKTIGSILEKLVVCVIEKYILLSEKQLSINPAKGVDIPELELGIKSPSTNYCTSEPYFSAYERLLGNEYDAIIMLTDFQKTKGESNLNLRIVDVRYLHGTEIADQKLCKTAKQVRDNTSLDDNSIKKLFRFFAYVNQSDWEAKRILELINRVVIGKKDVVKELSLYQSKFEKDNRAKAKKNNPLLDPSIMTRLQSCASFKPVEQGVICAADNWVIDNQKDNGRYPNDNEWNRLLKSPLDGKITMSFALQWRYNFGGVFRCHPKR